MHEFNLSILPRRKKTPKQSDTEDLSSAQAFISAAERVKFNRRQVKSVKSKPEDLPPPSVTAVPDQKKRGRPKLTDSGKKTSRGRKRKQNDNFEPKKRRKTDKKKVDPAPVVAGEEEAAEEEGDEEEMGEDYEYEDGCWVQCCKVRFLAGMFIV